MPMIPDQRFIVLDALQSKSSSVEESFISPSMHAQLMFSVHPPNLILAVSMYTRINPVETDQQRNSAGHESYILA